MKKGPIVILIIVAMILLGGLDYWFSRFRNNEDQASAPSANSSSATYPKAVEIWTAEGGALGGFRVISRSRTQHLFERLGFETDTPYVIFYNLLQDSKNRVLEVYEIHGPPSLGNITYYNIKQQFLAQIADATAQINEVGTYGHNSFFYNDLNYPETGFLVVQVGSSVYGFKYLKKPADTFNLIEAAIQDLMK